VGSANLMNAMLPSLKDRLLSVSYYFGLAPLTRFWPSRSCAPFLDHHHRQALAGFFLLLVVLLAAGAFESAECFFLINFPRPGEIRILSIIWTTLDYIELFALAAFLPLWAVLIGLAVVGSDWLMPLLSWVSRKSWQVRIAFVTNLTALVLIPLVGAFAIWASSLTRRSNENGKVYFLYDEGIVVPRWGYAMGLYRIALQADRNWGMGSTILDHLTRETLRVALANGHVVILATHGEAGRAVTYFAPEMLGVWPADNGLTDETNSRHFLRIGALQADNKWARQENVSVNTHLQLAYVFACNAGDRASQWQEHLAPAQVVTYNRLSTVWDHALWFAFTGPAELIKLR
jgi:hypothetical protein